MRAGISARGQVALNLGEVDDGVITAGQWVGLIDDIPFYAKRSGRIIAGGNERLSVTSCWMQ